MDGFDRAWQHYPRHDAKKDARKAWDKLNPSPEMTDRIVQAVIAQVQDRARKLARQRWVPEWPYFATWIRGERWTDELAQPPVVRKTTYQSDEERDLV